MKYYGFRSVTIRFLGGLEIKLWARYYARSQSRATKGKGAYFGLLLLGVYNRCSPALASEVAQLAAAMNLKELHIDEATKVLFIADGAKWIWTRVSAMFKRLGLKNEQCMELVDFYHVAEHLNAFAGLKKKWSKRQKRGWVTRQKNLLKAGDVASFKAAVRELSKGCRGKDWRRERNYLLRNAEACRGRTFELRRGPRAPATNRERDHREHRSSSAQSAAEGCEHFLDEGQRGRHDIPTRLLQGRAMASP